MTTQTRFKPISFIVPGIPIRQPRQRHRVIEPKYGKAYAQNYTPKTDPVQKYKAEIQRQARTVYQGRPLKIPFSVQIKFIFPRQNVKIWKTKPMPRYGHLETPDGDNLEKAVLDALNKIIWQDDSCVCHVNRWKLRATGDENPHTEIKISQVIGYPQP